MLGMAWTVLYCLLRVALINISSWGVASCTSLMLGMVGRKPGLYLAQPMRQPQAATDDQ